jgi:hypothetical protein
MQIIWAHLVSTFAHCHLIYISNRLLELLALRRLMPLTDPTKVNPHATSTEVPLTSKCDSAELISDSVEMSLEFESPPLEDRARSAVGPQSTPPKSRRGGIDCASFDQVAVP